ncbi:MAG: hypothetical protein EBV92_09995, partial [Betaproteobacteria bacterium]|nr:hypothetical protein [Betaproteobacteria bacterium]
GEDDISATGDAGDNAITGNDGANSLFGGEGSDVLDGGAGDDKIAWSSGNVIAGPGNDQIIYTGRGDMYAAYWGSPAAVYIDLGQGYALDGWGTKDSLIDVRGATGSGFADTIIGSSGNDVFSDSWGGAIIDLVI